MSDALTKRRRVTAADVAQFAGVSRSAVSRAFTQGAYLDAEKRARILNASEELGYRPNALAAGLQGRASNLVAIFVGDMPNPYDKEVAAQLISGLNEAGKWPVMIGGSGGAALAAIDDILRYPLDAMILRAGSLGEDISARCIKLGIPVISSGRLLESESVDNVCVRNSQGMREATLALLHNGRRSTAMIEGPSTFWSAQKRKDGAMSALDEMGLEFAASETGDYTVQGGYDAAARIISSAGHLDGIVCANDAMAIGAMAYLRENGRRVPLDIGVVGFDDMEMANWPGIRLTTCRNPISAMVGAITSLLERRVAEPDAPAETRMLSAELVLRNTH